MRTRSVEYTVRSAKCAGQWAQNEIPTRRGGPARVYAAKRLVARARTLIGRPSGSVVGNPPVAQRRRARAARRSGPGTRDVPAGEGRVAVTRTLRVASTVTPVTVRAETWEPERSDPMTVVVSK